MFLDANEHDDSSYESPRDALLRRDALKAELVAQGHTRFTSHVRTIDSDAVDVDCSGEIDWEDVCPRCGVLQGRDALVCAGCGVSWEELEAQLAHAPLQVETHHGRAPAGTPRHATIEFLTPAEHAERHRRRS